MRTAALFLVIGVVLFSQQASAQTSSTQSPTGGSTSQQTLSGGTSAGATSTSAPQDPQAVSVLNQALTTAGGTQTISGLADYTATGNITYYGGQQVQGTVTVLGLNQTNVRVDANLPTGVRSWAVYNGILSTKTENGTVLSQMPKTNAPSSDAFPYQTPLFPSSFAFPSKPLGRILASQPFAISNNGVTEVDGHSVQVIQVQFVSSATASSKGFTSVSPSMILFVDTTSFQIVMVRQMLSKNVPHDIHYSDYVTVGGVLIPFVISEYIGGQPFSTIQLSQITFNSGLQASAFALQ